MALPSLDKTWQFDVNQELISTGNITNDFRQMWLAIKNSLIGFGSNPWVVVASSDGSTADSNDNWSVTTDLNWNTAGNPHSWMHLRQTGISANFELIIDHNAVSSNYSHMLWSPTGFDVAGSTTNRPSSSTGAEVTVFNSSWLSSGAFDCRFHIMMSTDGQCTRFFSFQTYSNPRVASCFIIDKVKNPVTGWTVPAVSLYDIESGNSVCDYGGLNDNVGTKGYHGKQIDFYVASEFYYGAATGQRITFPNDIDGSYPMIPAGLHSRTPGVRGRHGQFFDLWWGSTAITQYAGSYPEGTGRQFVHFGNLIFPWNGTPVLMYGGPW